MRYAFNETFRGEFTRSFKMVDPTLTANCAADLDALKASGALAEGFYDRALPLGSCLTPTRSKQRFLRMDRRATP